VPLPPWPGRERVLAVSAAVDGKFYLFSGRVQQAGTRTEILTDAHVFDPATLAWKTLANVNGWLRGGGDGWSVMAGTAAACRGEILFFGGARGTFFMRLEELDFAIAGLREKMVAADAAVRAGLQGEIDACLEKKRVIQEEHPGFAREILAYDTARDEWRVLGRLPTGSQVTTQAVWWGDAVVIPSGEISPGVRTNKIWRGRF
jgi:N-acetylneuraminic acid mutarotase